MKRKRVLGPEVAGMAEREVRYAVARMARVDSSERTVVVSMTSPEDADEVDIIEILKVWDDNRDRLLSRRFNIKRSRAGTKVRDARTHPTGARAPHAHIHKRRSRQQASPKTQHI